MPVVAAVALKPEQLAKEVKEEALMAAQEGRRHLARLQIQVAAEAGVHLANLRDMVGLE